MTSSYYIIYVAPVYSANSLYIFIDTCHGNNCHTFEFSRSIELVLIIRNEPYQLSGREAFWSETALDNIRTPVFPLKSWGKTEIENAFIIKRISGRNKKRNRRRPAEQLSTFPCRAFHLMRDASIRIWNRWNWWNAFLRSSFYVIREAIN